MSLTTLPASLQPGSILPNGARVIAARMIEQPGRHPQSTNFVVLALTHEGQDYVVWQGHLDNSQEQQVVTYWGNYYPSEHVEALARAVVRFHRLVGENASALLVEEATEGA